MSDRCYVELVCAPQHEKEFEEIGFHAFVNLIWPTLIISFGPL